MNFHYTDSLALEQLPIVDISAFHSDILGHVAEGWRLVCLCGLPHSLLPAHNKGTAPKSHENPEEQEGVGLLALLAHDASGMIHAVSTPPLTAWPSLTPVCPQAHLFEREIYEQWGIMPEGHPWLKPVRYCPPAALSSGMSAGLPTGSTWQRPLPGVTEHFAVQGPEIHEVAVGPVHAGVIEPGHFRFQCYGENVLHLEISLGFQHRGVEQKLMGGPDARTVYLIECVAGDSTIAHTTAFCQLLENLTHRPATPRGQALRRIGLELERLANHTGDLGALGGDVGYLPTASWCGRIRGDFLNLTALLCGNRFGRGLVRRGGVAHDIFDPPAPVDPVAPVAPVAPAGPCNSSSPNTAQECLTTFLSRLHAAHRDVRGAVDTMLASATVLDRFENTGVVSRQTAQDIGLVGLAAKASGLVRDARAFYPDDAPPLEKFPVRTGSTGDVYARARVRREELDDSVARIVADATKLPAGPACHDEILSLPPQRLCLSFVEGWRGTVCHVALTTADSVFGLYKIVDPSFHNWLGLALALRGEQISDFPLCNKSFNLSYCGHDL